MMPQNGNMKLSGKVLLLGHLIMLTGLLTTLGIDFLITRPALASLEEATQRQLAQAIIQSLAQEADTLGRIASDWAEWDQTVTFMLRGDAEYAGENLNPSSFISLRVDHMVFIRNDGRICWSGRYDKTQDVVVLDAGLDELTRRLRALAGPDGALDLQGIVIVGPTPCLAALRQVRPVDLPVLPPGHLLMLRELDNEFWAHLGQVVGTRLTASLRTDGPPYPGGQSSSVISEGGLATTAFKLLPVDLFGRQELEISGKIPRLTEKTGLRVLRMNTVALGFVMVAMVWAFLVLVLRSVVRPIRQLGGLFAELHRSTNFELRSALPNRDEIGDLSREIDGLIATLGDQRRSLERLATTDALTGLPNRRSFDDALDLAWRVCRREQRPLGLVMIDVDHFKWYNDHYGHQGGDFCLRQVAEAVQAAAHRPSDIRARYGGEEFVLVLPGADPAGCKLVAQRLCDAVYALALPHAAAPLGRVSISLGCASVVPGPDQSPAQLVEAADRQLYAAKSAGRNRVAP